MTNAQTLVKLNKTANSLSAHIARGNTINGSRSLELVDRFEELKSKAQQSGVWEEFCKARGFDPHTGAYDFFA